MLGGRAYGARACDLVMSAEVGQRGQDVQFSGYLTAEAPRGACGSKAGQSWATDPDAGLRWIAYLFR